MVRLTLLHFLHNPRRPYFSHVIRVESFVVESSWLQWTPEGAFGGGTVRLYEGGFGKAQEAGDGKCAKPIVRNGTTEQCRRRILSNGQNSRRRVVVWKCRCCSKGRIRRRVGFESLEGCGANAKFGLRDCKTPGGVHSFRLEGAAHPTVLEQ